MTKTVSGRRIDDSQWKLACEDAVLSAMRTIFASPLCPADAEWIEFESLMNLMHHGWKEADVRAVLRDLIADGVLMKKADQDSYGLARPSSARDMTGALERRIHRIEAIVADLEMRMSQAEATD